MELSFAGLIGAVLGTMLSALLYGPLIDAIEGGLRKRGAMPKDREREYYDSYLAGIFRTLRFGTGEAHGRAEMMEFNYLFEQGAIRREASGAS